MRSSLYFLAAVLFVLAACSPLADSTCDRLFLVEEPIDDSLPPAPHIPPEAQITPSPSSAFESRRPVPTVLPCPDSLDILPPQEVVAGSLPDTSHFLLAPSGQQMAIWAGGSVSILSLATGTRRETGLSDVPRFWLDDRTLVLSHYVNRQPKVYAFHLETGQRTTFEIRWEYNDVPPADLPGRYYTGWQAIERLEMSKRTLCDAVRDGRLQTLAAADGSLLLQRENLIEHGGELIREAHPQLLSYDEIARLRETAGHVTSVVSVPLESPIRHAYWPRILVLTGLPAEPHNLVVYAASESHWNGLPLVPNQLDIDDSGSPLWTDTGSEFFVSRETCPGRGDEAYPYVLYRRQGNSVAKAVGILPYRPDYWASLVWSPDGRTIYLKQPVDGRWSIARLALPAP